jgi:hypothetical protein
VTVQNLMQALCDYYMTRGSYGPCQYSFVGFRKSAKSTEHSLILEVIWDTWVYSP